MAKLDVIEGIGSVYMEKLHTAGIRSTEALLKRCGTAAGRQEVEAATGISGKLLLEWANHADLFRINGIGPEYADLLEAAGVDTIPELAQRNPDNLHAALVRVNEEKNLVRRLPTADMVRGWVEQAKQLPRAIEY